MKTPDVLLPALRQYQHNDCSGLISGFEHKETCKIVTGLQAKLRELAEAAEWRDECRETAPFRPTWAGSDNSRIRCCNLDYFGNEELAKSKLAAETAYQAALEAAKEG